MSFSFVCVNLFVIAWEQRIVDEIANRFDNLRIPVSASERLKGNIPYYGANGIQDYVEGFTHEGEFVLVAEDGANDLKNYPVQYVNGKVWVNNHAHVLQSKSGISDNLFLMNSFKNINIEPFLVGGGRSKLNADLMMKISLLIPSLNEQTQIGNFFQNIDNLITLHQRTQKIEKGKKMFNNINKEDTLSTYFAQWITVYKKGAIRDVTLSKYQMTHTWIEKIAPSLRLSEINRMSYQQLLNEYELYHEKQTTMDFHHHLKGAILDAVDEGLIDRDPTRKAIIKGKNPREKKPKFLNQYELHTLIKNLKLGDKINWDWLILLVAKTGMRFSEALALTPSDFDFAQQSISISKTWDYKKHGGFLPTKNKSSVRKLQVDWQTTSQFSNLLKNYPKDEPIFVAGRVFNSTVNTILYRHCKQLNIPTITIHGLRHTHASLLLFAGVSIASVARRLGHSSITTTQKTYLHIIHELENQDTDLVIRSLSRLV